MSNAGARVDLIKGLTSWWCWASTSRPAYATIAPTLSRARLEKRQDWIIIPGASLTFPNLFAYQSDLRLDYRYLSDQSNDPSKSFHDHIVTASIISRFDPTLPPPWATGRR